MPTSPGIYIKSGIHTFLLISSYLISVHLGKFFKLVNANKVSQFSKAFAAAQLFFFF